MRHFLATSLQRIKVQQRKIFENSDVNEESIEEKNKGEKDRDEENKKESRERNESKQKKQKKVLSENMDVDGEEKDVIIIDGLQEVIKENLFNIPVVNESLRILDKFIVTDYKKVREK